MNYRLRRFGLLLCVVLTVLTGCSNSTGQGGTDPKAVKAELTTEPAQAAVGKSTLMGVNITGLNDEIGVEVQLSIINNDNKGVPASVIAESAGEGRYEAEYTFEEAAEYNVYIHIYKGDLHVTKKKTVVVTE